jgi:hypothetical protein
VSSNSTKYRCDIHGWGIGVRNVDGSMCCSSNGRTWSDNGSIDAMVTSGGSSGLTDAFRAGQSKIRAKIRPSPLENWFDAPQLGGGGKEPGFSNMANVSVMALTSVIGDGGAASHCDSLNFADSLPKIFQGVIWVPGGRQFVAIGFNGLWSKSTISRF